MCHTDIKHFYTNSCLYIKNPPLSPSLFSFLPKHAHEGKKARNHQMLQKKKKMPIKKCLTICLQCNKKRNDFLIVQKEEHDMILNKIILIKEIN